MEPALAGSGPDDRAPSLPEDALSGGPMILGLVYDDLRRAARGMMRRSAWRDQSIEPTGLVNEAVARLLRDPALRGRTDIRYVFAAALEAMRRILVERARIRRQRKRGGDWVRLPLDQVLDRLEAKNVDMIELEDALRCLARRSPRQAEAITLHLLMDLSVGEIAAHLGQSVTTTRLDLRLARVWLYRKLVAS